MEVQEILKEANGYRVSLRTQKGPENPREDSDANIVSVVTVSHRRYVDVPGECGYLSYVWDYLHYRHGRDAAELFARTVRVLGGAAVVDTPNDGPVSVWYLMPDVIAEHGITDAAAAIEGERAEYRAWAKGEVYGIIIEKAVDWKRTDGSTDSMTTWEQVFSCWGFIGFTYARDEALREFEPYTK